MRRILIAVAVIVPTTLFAQSSGWRYATRITVDSGNGVPRTTALRHIVTPAALRIGIEGLTDTYTITNEVDSTTIMIMPGSRTATIMPIIRSSLSTVRLPAMTPHYTVHTTEDLGPGEPILGHATRHYRMTSKGTMEVAFEGKTCTRPINDVAETWTASDVDLKPALDLVLRHSGSSLSDALSRNAANLDPDAASRGFPLKTVFRQTAVDPAGLAHTTTTTAEYTEIYNGTIDDSVFAIPADYRTMDMRRFANQIRPDSTRLSTLTWAALCGPLK